MNSVKNFTTIHLWLNQTDVLEVAIPLMTYLVKYRGFKSKRGQNRNKLIKNINKAYIMRK